MVPPESLRLSAARCVAEGNDSVAAVEDAACPSAASSDMAGLLPNDLSAMMAQCSLPRLGPVGVPNSFGLDAGIGLAAPGSSPPARRRRDARAVEARHWVPGEGQDFGEWQRFPSIATAARALGLHASQVNRLCTTRSRQGSWEVRFADSEAAPDFPPAPRRDNSHAGSGGGSGAADVSYGNAAGGVAMPGSSAQDTGSGSFAEAREESLEGPPPPGAPVRSSSAPAVLSRPPAMEEALEAFPPVPSPLDMPARAVSAPALAPTPGEAQVARQVACAHPLCRFRRHTSQIDNRKHCCRNCRDTPMNLLPIHGGRCQRILAASHSHEAATPSSRAASASSPPCLEALPPSASAAGGVSLAGAVQLQTSSGELRRHPSNGEEDSEPPRKRRIVEAKPAEARFEGSLLALPGEVAGNEEENVAGPGEWLTFPSISMASRETGVPNGSIAGLCDMQALHHTGWRFRWPGMLALPARPLRPHELDLLARRIREQPDASARRATVVNLPEAVRQQLTQFLREGHVQPQQPTNSSSRMAVLLNRLPELLSAASDEKKGKLLEGLRTFQTIHLAVLSAATVADIAEILREVSLDQRVAIMERLPSETNEALIDHLTQEKRKAAARKGAEAAAAKASTAIRMVVVPGGEEDEGETWMS